MQHTSPIKTSGLFLSLIIAVIVLSTISGRIWGGKPETITAPTVLTINEEMTLEDFGQANNIANPVLKELFGLQQRTDLQKRLSEFGSHKQIKERVTKKMALVSEHESKNWKKILIKFLAWFAFLTTVFFMFRKRKVHSKNRNLVLLSSVMLFGVVLGSDPSPMGTVKDAIHLFATSGAVFPPRLIALSVFLLTVFLANKFICSWGCQLGTLQDLIFRLNQDGKNKAVVGQQKKLPFLVTNSIRVTFFIFFTVVAFIWGLDIIETIDPFKIFKPLHLGITGIVFTGAVLVMSLFVYRPWCHLFCPFGLVGWLVEKVSRVKISVDYQSCIGCGKCAAACPTTVMGAILKQDMKTIPDCFSCYACREVCPTESISFSTRRRTIPPAGHFDAKVNDLV